MTKTEAMKQAKMVLRRGHFRPGVGINPIPGTGSVVYIYCPICNEKIIYNGMAWDRGSKLEIGLRCMLAEHIADEH